MSTNAKRYASNTIQVPLAEHTKPKEQEGDDERGIKNNVSASKKHRRRIKKAKGYGIQQSANNTQNKLKEPVQNPKSTTESRRHQV